MEVQECGSGIVLRSLGQDPQSNMIAACLRFQRSLGMWDDRISSIGASTFVDVTRTIHHLDMARQEGAEAWDMLEGGWKHHKKVPKPPNLDELVLELVDVATFVFNAYLYMGGQHEAVLVALAANQSNSRVSIPSMGMEESWAIAENSWRVHGRKLETLYGHGDGSHGEMWVKFAATRVNHLNAKISSVVETIRSAVELDQAAAADGSFPASSGYIYTEIMPWLYGVLQVIPGVSKQSFFSAFMHKNEINFARQTKGY